MPNELSRQARLRLDRFSGVLRRFGLVDRDGIGVHVALADNLTLSKLQRILSPLSDALPQGVTVDFLAESVHAALSEACSDTLAWRERFAPARPQLAKICTGRKHASNYHKHVFDLLKAIFDGFLTNGKVEQEINSGIQRIDIMFDNTDGVFCQIAKKIRKPSPWLPFECKNYAGDLGNPEYDQLSGRLNPHIGGIGVLVFRSITNWDRANNYCQAKGRDGKVILLLDDDDLARMYKHRCDGKQDLVDKVVLDRFRSLMLNVRAKGT